MAKQTVLLSDEDKTRVGKASSHDKLPPIKSKKLIPIASNGNLDILDADELLKKQKKKTRNRHRNGYLKSPWKRA